MKATLFLLMLSASPALAGESPAVDQAKAALALAKAAREREAAKAVTMSKHCFKSHGEAAFVAAKTRKPLVLWVGMCCEDSPVIREALPDAVHCHLPAFNGDDSPRVVFTGPDGRSWQYDKDQLNEKTAAKIRERTGLPETPEKR